MIETSDRIYSFADFELDTARRRLLKGGQPLALNPKALDLLLVLIVNRERVLSKNELLETVWENLFVEENNLTVHISALRKAFGEKKGDHRFIVTIPGRGYSFVAKIQGDDSDKTTALTTSTNSVEKTSDSPNNLRLIAAEDFNSSDNLIGRTRELAAIEDFLRGGETRLITLTGTGGTGKTALAQAIARRPARDFEDGVFFIELAAVNNSEMVIPFIARTLGILETEKRTPVEVLIDFLRERRTLLILDNFEQILSAAPLLQKIVDSTEVVKILVTSRAALRVDAEREIAVTPLDVPPPGASLAKESLIEYAAVTLFIRRAQKARQDFVLTTENAPGVAEICRKLDGLPLAVELAAARIRLLSPQSILERLRHSLEFLTGGAKNLPSRRRTMRGAIEWSYELLDAQEKKMFRRLAVFSGGFAIEAAEFIAEAENGEKADDAGDQSVSALDVITTLIENNLLTCKTPADGDARLGMLEVVREYAGECLEASGESNFWRQTHARYFLALAEEAEPQLLSADSTIWLAQLQLEYDNLCAALDWSLENETDTAVRMAAALRFFWLHQSRLTEGDKWLEAALDQGVAASLKIRFKLLAGLGLLKRLQGDYLSAQRFYAQSLMEGKAADDRRQIALSSSGLGTAFQLQGDFDQARKLYEEGLAVSREINDDFGVATSLECLASLRMKNDEASAARLFYEEALTLYRKMGNHEAVGNVLSHLGTIALKENEDETARRLFAECFSTAEKIGCEVNLVDALNGFAVLAAKNNDAEQALYLAGAADNLREAINYEVETSERLFRDSYLAGIRRVLDEKTYDAVYQTGRTLELSEALALVKETPGEMNGQFAEIIVKTHEYRRIVIEEDTEYDFPDDLEIQPLKKTDKSTKDG